MTADPDIAVVRDAIEWVGDTPHDIVDTRILKADSLAALDRLEARVAKLEEMQHEMVVAYHARLREKSAAEAERDEARRALNGFRWLESNRHNYGSDRWLVFFDAAMEDASAALAAEETT